MSTRRRFLQLSLLGTGALALGGLGLGLRPGRLWEPDRPLKVLTQRQYSTLIAFALAALELDPSMPSPEEVELGIFLDAQLAEGPPSFAKEVCQGLQLLENALPGFLLEGRTKPFTALDPVLRRAVIRRWAEGRYPLQRQLIRGLSALVSVAYWSSPKVWPHVGYPGPPPVPWVDPPPADPPPEDDVSIDSSANPPAEEGAP